MMVLERIDTPAELHEAARLLKGALTAFEREALLAAVNDYQDRQELRGYRRSRTPTPHRLVAA